MLEQRCEILPAIDLQKITILAKTKSSFQMKLILIVKGMLHNWTLQPFSQDYWPSFPRLNKDGKYCGRSTYRKSRFWQKQNHLFRWSSAWVCKQAKLSYLGHRKHARIHWKVDAPKTNHCLVWIFVQRHNCDIFLRKWARRGRYNQWRSVSGHVEWIFIHKNWREGYLVSTGRRYVPHSRSYTRCFTPCFWRSHYQP